MVLSIQTLWCDTHIFNSGAVHFFWSSLRWFYAFIWVQLCLIILIGLDWESHTPVYIRPYSSQCMSEQMRIMRSKELPEELRDRIVARHRSGQGYKNISAALKVPKSTVASRALVREVKKNPKITVAELQRCIQEMGESCRKPWLKPNWASLERPKNGCPPMFTIQPDRTGEDLQGGMAEDPQIQVWKTCCIFPKKTHGCIQSKGCFY